MLRRKPTHWFVDQLNQLDSRKLQLLINEEIKYHNTLLDTFSRRVRTMPVFLIDLVGPWVELFGDVAYHNINLRTQTTENLSPVYEKYRGLLFDKNGNSKLDSKTLLFYDIVTTPSYLQPEMRKSIAIELLKYHQEQAINYTRLSNNPEFVFRDPPQMLNPMENRKKKHYQALRSTLTEEVIDKELHIKIPYLDHVFKIPMEFKYKPWTMMTLRNDGEYALRYDTSYLLRLRDPK